MYKILPIFLSLITGNPRYFPEITWSSNCWTHNIFRVYEMLFGRRVGIRAEMRSTTWKENNETYATYNFYTWESLIAHTEGMIRMFCRGFRFRIIYVPVMLPVYVGTGSSKPFFNFAIAFDASSSGADENNTSVTVAHTTSGSDRLIVSCGYVATNGDITTSMKYAGVTETIENKFLASGGRDTAQIVQCTLAAPTSGTNNVVYTVTTTTRVYVGSISLTGAAQSAYKDGTAQAEGTNNTAASVSVTTGTANSMLIDAINASASTTYTAGGSQANAFSNAAVRPFAGSTQTTTTTGSYTMSWTLGTSRDWNHVVIGIKQVAAAVIAQQTMMTLGIG